MYRREISQFSGKFRLSHESPDFPEYLPIFPMHLECLFFCNRIIKNELRLTDEQEDQLMKECLDFQLLIYQQMQANCPSMYAGARLPS